MSEKLRPGDEVRVFPGGRYAAHPDGGWPGVVTSVARKYATAEYDDGQIVEFSMETGFGRDAHPYYGMRVMTPAEIALDERRKQAEQVYDQVRDQVYDQVYGQVGGQVAGQVRGQFRDQVYDQVYGQVAGQVAAEEEDR